jgi:hypothetical protein
VSFGREARRDEAAGKGTPTDEHARINRRRWPRLEGYGRARHRVARYAAGGGGGGFGGLGGGGFGGLGGGGFGGLGCSMATRQVK